MKVLFYGRLADAIGREVDLSGPAHTAGELRRMLEAHYPESAGVLRQSRAVAGGKIIAGDDQSICEYHEVELLPPVCGG